MEKKNNTIREYILIKGENDACKLREIQNFDWYGDTVSISEIDRLLREKFHMGESFVEKSYVVAYDYAKNIKGICQVGQGGCGETPTPSQPIFTFLLLCGANSFILAHNHISDMPYPSYDDNCMSFKVGTQADNFDIDFVTHLIISPHEFYMNGGSLGSPINVSGEEREKEEYQEYLIESESNEQKIIHLENGMAATYVFGNRIEGSVEEIKKLVGCENE